MFNYAKPIAIGLFLGISSSYATAAPLESVVTPAAPLIGVTPHTKKLGDVSYRTMWRLQTRAAALLPKSASVISPVLRLSADNMAESERTEFLPQYWAVAIVGKTVDMLVPMRRGGYFELPALPQAQARNEDAFVMFNKQASRNGFDVAWNVHVPSNGTLAYTQFGQALAEVKLAQNAMPWWDIMAIPEKKAQFNAIRACFNSQDGRILVGGIPSGHKLSVHCTVLAFDASQLRTDPAIDFVGGLEFVTLDNSATDSLRSADAN